MDFLKLLADFYKDAERQGPGSDECTLKALSYIPTIGKIENILDIGCGTGAQTTVLAKNTNAKITAIDIFETFLEVLNKKIAKQPYEDRVKTIKMEMEKLDFPEKSFDLIWAEGSIYIIGFEKGLNQWKKYLKDGGYLVASEISWLREERPHEIEDYWNKNYPEISGIEEKIQLIEKCGYSCVDHFTLPETCWTDRFYKYNIGNSEAFLRKYKYAPEVKEFVKGNLEEAELYNKYQDYYSYVFYIMKKS